MVEGKFVVEQAYELQMISQDVLSEGIWVDEQMQVSAIIDKLWNSMEQMVIRQNLFLQMKTCQKSMQQLKV